MNLFRIAFILVAEAWEFDIVLQARAVLGGSAWRVKRKLDADERHIVSVWLERYEESRGDTSKISVELPDGISFIDGRLTDSPILIDSIELDVRVLDWHRPTFLVEGEVLGGEVFTAHVTFDDLAIEGSEAIDSRFDFGGESFDLLIDLVKATGLYREYRAQYDDIPEERRADPWNFEDFGVSDVMDGSWRGILDTRVVGNVEDPGSMFDEWSDYG
jgi:hypothetical protein